MIEYTLIRSKRKTLALQIKNGGVEVRAPLKISKSEIDKFVKSKENWLTKNLQKSQERVSQRESFTIDYNSRLLYRGKQYPISARMGKRVGFDFDNEQFYLPQDLSQEQIKAACVQIYRMLAKRDLTDKVLDYAKKMSVSPIAVKVNNANTRWGSCSVKKNLNFSWRLIMADDDVIDYVVVHELAHITEMNHSERFWAIVEGILPDYRERKTWLKQLQQHLNGEDWE